MEQAVNYNRYLLGELASFSARAERILDFGAGNGRFAIGLRERGNEVHAVEPDSQLREHIASEGVVTHESLSALGGLDFDCIYTINVLEHVEDDRPILAGFFERMRPGGRLFIYVPAFPVLFSANDVRVGHVRRYRKTELVSKVERAGFHAESVMYVDSIGFAAGLAYRLLGDRSGDLNPRAVRLYDALVFPVSRVLDRAVGRFFGKNLLVRATRPA